MSTTKVNLSKHGRGLYVGNIIRKVDEPTITGVIVRIIEESDNTEVFFSKTGALKIETEHSTIFSERYGEWEHIPEEETTMWQRVKRWKSHPLEYDSNLYMDMGTQLTFEMFAAIFGHEFIKNIPPNVEYLAMPLVREFDEDRHKVLESIETNLTELLDKVKLHRE